MSEAAPTSRTQGRVIRAALVILPAGLIVTGIISFGIWHWKKQQVEQRSYKFATAMRRDLNSGAIDRYVSILRDVLAQPDDRRLGAVASFLDSSMGAENMGYNVRREIFHAGALEVANVDAELTGKQRFQEVVLLLVPYGQREKLETECQALAQLMSLAHAVTGEIRTRTLRFAGVPLGVKDSDGHTALERLAASSRSREERLMRVYVLGGPTETELAEIRSALNAEAQGTVIQGLPATTITPETLQAATALKPVLMSAIEE